MQNIINNLANVFKKYKPLEINIIIESEQPKKLNRLERIMKLYNQAMEDKQYHKALQAYRCIELAKMLRIQRTQTELQKEYLNRHIKNLILTNAK
jgi:hypothetical protein